MTPRLLRPLRRAVFASAAALALVAGIGHQARADSATGAYLAARHAAVLNDYENAATYYTRALAKQPGNVEMMEQAVLYKVAAGRVSDAVPIARSLVEKKPGHRIAQLVLVVDAIGKGEHEAAAERLDEHGSDSFNVITARLLEGWNELARGDGEAAQEAFGKLDSQRLFAVFGRYHAALAAAIDGDADAADAAFVKAVGDKAPSPRLAEAYGRFLEREDRADEAAELYAEALRGAPGDAVLEAAIDRATSAEAGTPELMIPTAESGAAEALFGLAGAFAREDGGVRLSLVYVQLALHLDDTMDPARILLGNVMEAQQRWDDAAETFARIGEDSPYFRTAQIGRADALGRIERVDEALEALEGLEENYPEDVSLPIARGDLLRRVERYAEAGTAYDRALGMIDEPEPRHWSLFYARGVTQERIGNWDKAEADLQQALEFRPDQAHVLNYLGYSWIEQGRNLEEARGMIEKAVRLRPDDGYITDSLGWVQYRLGDFDQAVETMERAVELMPTDPVINDHYGDTLWIVGRRLEARFQWKRALSFDPEEEDLKERILRKLDVGLDKVLLEEREEMPEESEGVADAPAEPEVPVKKKDADDG